jgi:DNA-binding response OmpR family regulator
MRLELEREKIGGQMARVASSGHEKDRAIKLDDHLVAELCRPRQRPPRVLVVDDEPDARTLLKFILEPKYQVITVASATEAREALENDPEPMNLVLMDLKLDGGEDGVTLTRQLRGEDRWKEVPIVALTACSTAEDVQNALEAGCDDYIPKPFYRRQLLALIERLVS